MHIVIALGGGLLIGFLGFSIVWCYSHSQWMLMGAAGLALTVFIKFWRERVSPWYRKNFIKSR